MNMIKVNDLPRNDSQSDFSDDQSDQEIPVVRSADFANRFQTIKPIQELQLQHSRRTKGFPFKDLSAVNNLTPLMQMNFFHTIFIRLKFPSHLEYEHPENQGGLFSIFTCVI